GALREARFLKWAVIGAGRLPRPGHDETRRIATRRLQCLTGEEHERGLHDGKHERKKRRGDETEFDGRRALLVPREIVRRASRNRAGTPEEFGFHESEHGPYPLMAMPSHR